ncbi:MAG: CPBP family intramembrane metalloprotease [Bacillota bacterium]|nr:CPBP family intramembrane metalloprotease [Bacillota bacterium]
MRPVRPLTLQPRDDRDLPSPDPADSATDAEAAAAAARRAAEREARRRAPGTIRRVYARYPEPLIQPQASESETAEAETVAAAPAAPAAEAAEPAQVPESPENLEVSEDLEPIEYLDDSDPDADWLTRLQRAADEDRRRRDAEEAREREAAEREAARLAAEREAAEREAARLAAEREAAEREAARLAAEREAEAAAARREAERQAAAAEQRRSAEARRQAEFEARGLDQASTSAAEIEMPSPSTGTAGPFPPTGSGIEFEEEIARPRRRSERLARQAAPPVPPAAAPPAPPAATPPFVDGTPPAPARAQAPPPAPDVPQPRREPRDTSGSDRHRQVTADVRAPSLPITPRELGENRSGIRALRELPQIRQSISSDPSSSRIPAPRITRKLTLIPVPEDQRRRRRELDPIFSADYYDRSPDEIPDFLRNTSLTEGEANRSLSEERRRRATARLPRDTAGRPRDPQTMGSEGGRRARVNPPVARVLRGARQVNPLSHGEIGSKVQAPATPTRSELRRQRARSGELRTVPVQPHYNPIEFESLFATYEAEMPPETGRSRAAEEERERQRRIAQDIARLEERAKQHAAAERRAARTTAGSPPVAITTRSTRPIGPVSEVTAGPTATETAAETAATMGTAAETATETATAKKEAVQETDGATGSAATVVETVPEVAAAEAQTTAAPAVTASASPGDAAEDASPDDSQVDAAGGAAEPESEDGPEHEADAEADDDSDGFDPGLEENDEQTPERRYRPLTLALLRLVSPYRHYGGFALLLSSVALLGIHLLWWDRFSGARLEGFLGSYSWLVSGIAVSLLALLLPGLLTLKIFHLPGRLIGAAGSGSGRTMLAASLLGLPAGLAIFGLDRLILELQAMVGIEDIAPLLPTVPKPGGILDILLILFVICIVKSSSEEFLFRGLLQSDLRRGGNAGLAVILQALAYVLYRGDIGHILTALAIALLLGWLRGRSNSLYPAIGCHIMINVAWHFAATPAWSAVVRLLSGTVAGPLAPGLLAAVLLLVVGLIVSLPLGLRVASRYAAFELPFEDEEARIIAALPEKQRYWFTLDDPGERIERRRARRQRSPYGDERRIEESWPGPLFMVAFLILILVALLPLLLL